MKDDRLRIPVDASYVEVLGRATFIFAILEWNAVWCCEKMRPNYIRTLGRKTAGKIAGDFVRLAKRHWIPATRSLCISAAQKFEALVEKRNALLHGKPGTVTPTGEQRLFDKGIAWTPSMIDDLSDQFAECRIALNGLLYNQLK
jgi:hypothetical protein